MDRFLDPFAGDGSSLGSRFDLTRSDVRSVAPPPRRGDRPRCCDRPSADRWIARRTSSPDRSFPTYPTAPARTIDTTVLGSVLADSATIWVSGERRRISRAARLPPPPGIRTSRRATSGRWSSARSIASPASCAVPTRSMSGSVDTSSRIASRTGASSSASISRMRPTVMPPRSAVRPSARPLARRDERPRRTIREGDDLGDHPLDILDREPRSCPPARRGSHTSSVVPWPGRLQSFVQPPAISARSRIAARPRWPGAATTASCGLNPTPSSTICIKVPPSRRCNVTRTWARLRVLAGVRERFLGDPIEDERGADRRLLVHLVVLDRPVERRVRVLQQVRERGSEPFLLERGWAQVEEQRAHALDRQPHDVE